MRFVNTHAGDFTTLWVDCNNKITIDRQTLGYYICGMAKRKTKLQEAASYMGMIGGRSRSPKKVHAARVNGKKGGRPKKVLDKQNA